jgi:hypothetical protein
MWGGHSNRRDSRAGRCVCVRRCEIVSVISRCEKVLAFLSLSFCTFNLVLHVVLLCRDAVDGCSLDGDVSRLCQTKKIKSFYLGLVKRYLACTRYNMFCTVI